MISSLTGSAERLLIRWDGLAVLAKTIQVSSDGVGGHDPGFHQSVAFGHKARQGWTSDYVATFLSWLKQDGILDLFTNWHLISS